MVLANLAEFSGSIGQLFDFGLRFIFDIGYIVELLSRFVLNIPGYFGWLPSPVVTLLGIAFAIVVVYMILNRK